MRQISVFAGLEGELEVPKSHKFFQVALGALRQVGEPVRNKVNIDVKSEPIAWKEFFKRDFISGLVRSGQRILVLFPEQSFVDLFLLNMPKTAKEKCFVFDPELPAGKYEELSKILYQEGPALIVGKRSSNYLCLFSHFDQVIVFDPSSRHYESQQFPHYNALLNIYLYALVMPISVRLIPLAPTYPFTSWRTLPIKTLALTGSTDERIHSTAQIIAKQARAGKRILVFTDALGVGQRISCVRCDEMLNCPRCSRPLGFSADEEVFFCTYCNFSASDIACPACGAKDLSIQLVGVEGIAKLVRKNLKSMNLKVTPRVGALYQKRRERIRVANLGRTDVLVGTSTLFSPIAFYKPRTIIYLAREQKQKGLFFFYERQLEQELCRIHSLYATDKTDTVCIGSKAILDIVTERLGPEREKLLANEEQTKAKYGLPPYGVLVEFCAYSTHKGRLAEIVSELKGQLEFTQRLLLWEASDALVSRQEGKFVLRGWFLADSVDETFINEFRTNAKRKRVDIVFAPNYH